MTVHAKISPSSAHRIMGCPGSVNLIATLPKQKSSKAANEGTLAHQILAECILNDSEPSDYMGKTFKIEDDMFLVSEEMVDGIALALQTVDEYLDKGYTVEVEQQIALDHLCAEQFGTGDIVLTNKNDGVLGVLDFKYGRVVDVAVEDNPQLLCYLSGVVHKVKNNGAFPISNLFMGIIQPRGASAPVRIIDVFLNELRGFEAEFQVAAAKALNPNAPLIAGNHCEWCAAAGVCPAFKELAEKKAQMEFKSLGKAEVAAPPTPLDLLTPQQVGSILQHATLIEHWIESVRGAALQAAISTGVMPEGYKLVRKRTNRKWLDDERAAAALAFIYDLDDEQIYTKKLISPAQAEKVLGKAAKESLAPLWRNPPGDPTLALLSDKRETLVVDPQHELRALLQNSVDTEGKEE